MDFKEFFITITGRPPLPYQEEYATHPFESTLLQVPTGLGKTFAAITPWLHRVANGGPDVPTRVFFVLPRQNLTEQTYRVVVGAVRKAGLKDKVRVVELMGASKDNRLTLGPDERAVIVCTQDMYFSRALNRGYARRPTRWPLDFALSNQDCLVVCDEVQLMSDALATSTQLAAFRKAYGIFGQAPCIWMSATLKPEWLDSVDFQSSRPTLRIIELSARDLEVEIVRQRIHAPKTIAKAPDECRTPEGCAAFVLEKHQPGERTLVIVNTVQRAKDVAGVLAKQRGVLLLHSRFRPGDRRKKVEELSQVSPEGQIVVSTQVLEAGIDISAHRLVTDAAPWGSLVQRFGRVNRGGELQTADIWWVDQPLRGKIKADDKYLYGPYPPEEVVGAMEKLKTLRSASPADLPAEDGSPPWRNVLRRVDLLDLFDTTPDLAGNAVDVSRFIRSGEQKDCYLAWRAWNGDLANSQDDVRAELRPDELCPVPIGELRSWSNKRPIYAWSFANKKWELAGEDSFFPGMMLLTNSANGGYTTDEGWNPESKKAVLPPEALLPISPEELPEVDEPEGDEDDPRSLIDYEQTLSDHTDCVAEEMDQLLRNCESLGIGDFREELRAAARKHDWGKAHDVMQTTLGRLPGGEMLAKQVRSKANRGHSRKNFRHELASALAMLSNQDSDLAAYLAAAHHGRIRMSIRSMPGDLRADSYRVRGMQEGDILPEANLGGGILTKPVHLSLRLVPMGSAQGEPSWLERAVRLRDGLGPFRLAFLEMLLRIADERASARGVDCR